MAGFSSGFGFSPGGGSGSGGLTEAEVDARIDLKQDVLSGQYIGSESTFAALPTTDQDSNSATAGDWAVLTENDGSNLKGIYRYNGTAYTFETSLGFESDVIETIASATTLTAAHDVVLCAGTFTVTLPAASTNEAKKYVIKNIAGSLITVGTTGGDLIDEEPSVDLPTKFQSIKVISDGSGWQIIN